MRQISPGHSPVIAKNLGVSETFVLEKIAHAVSIHKKNLSQMRCLILAHIPKMIGGLNNYLMGADPVDCIIYPIGPALQFALYAQNGKLIWNGPQTPSRPVRLAALIAEGHDFAWSE